MNCMVIACGSSSELRIYFRRLMSCGLGGHSLLSVLIIGCRAKVSSFSFIGVMEAATLEVVWSWMKVW